jgi:hypothetical protein
MSVLSEIYFLHVQSNSVCGHEVHHVPSTPTRVLSEPCMVREYTTNTCAILTLSVWQGYTPRTYVQFTLFLWSESTHIGMFAVRTRSVVMHTYTIGALSVWSHDHGYSPSSVCKVKWTCVQSELFLYSHYAHIYSKISVCCHAQMYSTV